MCRLVFVGVTGGSGDPHALFRAAGFTTNAAANPSCAAMPAKSVRLEVTKGGCSCEFYTDGETDEGNNPEVERRRYERKGWPKAKVDRAIEARLKSGDPRRHASGRRAADIRESFVKAIAQLVQSGAHVHLLAHDFTGAFVDPFEIRGTTELPLEDYLASGNYFPDDTLVSLVA